MRIRKKLVFVPLITLATGCTTIATDPSPDAIAPAPHPPAASPPHGPTAVVRTDVPRVETILVETAPQPADFWQQLRDDFRLPDEPRTRVTREIRKLRSDPRQVERVLQRGEPYFAYIYGEVRARDFPAELVLLPFIESGYDPFAYSHGSAAGLWQFIPATGRHYGLKQDWWYDGRRDIVASTQAALDYLDRLQQMFDGDWLLALAAYNAGEGKVRAAIRRNRKAGKPADFWHLRLPRETAAYVPKLLAISMVIREPGRYGIQPVPVEPEPDFTIVDIKGQLDIGIAAELAGMETDALYRLNPGFNRWATHPDGPHRLLIPVSRSAAFEENLAALPDAKRSRWVRHRIRKGETLSHIARRYDTTVAVLRSSNVLYGTTIRAGDHLLIPVAARDPDRYAAMAKVMGGSTAGRRSYTVRSGDSLWTIARRHGVTVNQLVAWNRLDSRTIRPGQKLDIGGRAIASAGKTTRTVNYTVRSGDSLYRISRKFRVNINELRRWNGLSKDKYLQPGQRLKVYVDVTRQG